LWIDWVAKEDEAVPLGGIEHTTALALAALSYLALCRDGR